jgi:hypothetical protein
MSKENFKKKDMFGNDVILRQSRKTARVSGTQEMA